MNKIHHLIVVCLSVCLAGPVYAETFTPTDTWQGYLSNFEIHAFLSELNREENLVYTPGHFFSIRPNDGSLANLIEAEFSLTHPYPYLHISKDRRTSE